MHAPSLVALVAKCYRGHSAEIVCTVESGEGRVLLSSAGVQQGNAFGMTLFCMGPVMVKTRIPHERKGA